MVIDILAECIHYTKEWTRECIRCYFIPPTGNQIILLLSFAKKSINMEDLNEFITS